jgi:hypothetical protein
MKERDALKIILLKTLFDKGDEGIQMYRLKNALCDEINGVPGRCCYGSLITAITDLLDEQKVTRTGTGHNGNPFIIRIAPGVPRPPNNKAKNK